MIIQQDRKIYELRMQYIKVHLFIDFNAKLTFALILHLILHQKVLIGLEIWCFFYAMLLMLLTKFFPIEPLEGPVLK